MVKDMISEDEKYKKKIKELKRRYRIAKKKQAEQEALDTEHGKSPFKHYYTRKPKLWDKNRCHISLQETKHLNDSRGSDWGFEIRQYAKNKYGKVVPVRGSGILIPVEDGKGWKFTRAFLRVFLDSIDDEGAENLLKWIERKVNKKLNREKYNKRKDS